MTAVGGVWAALNRVPATTPTTRSAPRGWPECPARKAAAVPSHCKETPEDRGSLLVVDDDPLLRRLLQRLLERDGYAVTCAASGAEALAVLREFLPDLVILDWMMPGLDGAEVLRRMAADAATATVRVLVYTASNDSDVEREAVRLGAWGCVQKLGGTADLREQIECCLGSPRPAARDPDPGLC